MTHPKLKKTSIGFERTSLSSSAAKRSTSKKAEARLKPVSLASAFMGLECFAPDEEGLSLSKPIVKFSFIYGVSMFFVCLFNFQNYPEKRLNYINWESVSTF